MTFLNKTSQTGRNLVLFVACGLLVAGCSSTRFGGNGGAGNPPTINMPQQNTYGTVTSTDLPPPGGYPQAPTMENGTQVASLEPPANAATLSPASVAGVWRANIGGMNCQIATPQTKFGQGYRAGPLQCPAAFSDVKSWGVSGSQLSFYNSAGAAVATLYSSGNGFSGQTTSGQGITLSR